MKKKVRVKKETKNVLSKSKLRAIRKNMSTLEDNHFAKITELKDSDPVEVLMKDIETEPVEESNVEQLEETSEELTIEQRICNFYISGKSIREVADNFKISQYKARTILLNNNIKMRPRGYVFNTEEQVQPVEKSEDIKVIEEPVVEEIQLEEPVVVEESTTVEDNEVVEEPVVEEIQEEPVVVEEPTTEVIEEPVEVKELKPNGFNFAGVDFINNKLKRVSFNISDDVFVAGLVRDRHDIPFVDKYIFETLTQSNFNTPKYCENKARGFINAYLRPDPNSDTHKTLIVYCTGLQLALSALVSVCAEMQINLITMHLNTDIKKYIAQKTLCIFGDNIPNTDTICNNSIKALSDKHNTIFTYGCSAEDLIVQGDCTYIKASFGEYSSKDAVLILCNKDFPDIEEWEMFGNLIKAMQSDNVEDKHHCVILGRINFSCDGYKYGELIAKSFNFRNLPSSK